MRRITAAVVAGLSVFTAVSESAPPAWADSSDDVFISALQGAGFPSVSRSTITGLGRSICDQLHNGVGFKKIATIAMDAGFTPGQGGDLMGAAVGAYCPDESDALHRWVANGEPG